MVVHVIEISEEMVVVSIPSNVEKKLTSLTSHELRVTSLEHFAEKFLPFLSTKPKDSLVL